MNTMNDEIENSFYELKLLLESTYKRKSNRDFKYMAEKLSNKMDAESSKLQELTAAIQAKIKQLQKLKQFHLDIDRECFYGS